MNTGLETLAGSYRTYSAKFGSPRTTSLYRSWGKCRDLHQQAMIAARRAAKEVGAALRSQCKMLLAILSAIFFLAALISSPG
jgi:hypothetical protein